MNSAERRAVKADLRRLEELAAEARARTLIHEAKFKAVPQCPEKDALRIAMLERAWWLLDEGQGEAADAILEFLPRWQVARLLTEFFETRNEFDPTIYEPIRPQAILRTVGGQHDA